MNDTAKNPVLATRRSLEIVEALREFDGVRVTTLADHLGINKGTVHNHLSTLRDHGYVIKDGNEYRLGLKFFELGEFVRKRNPLFAIAKPELDKLAAESGELANLMVEESGYGIYLYIAEGENALSLDTSMGTRQHLHTSAAGKAILANMSRERVKELVDARDLAAATPNTLTSAEALYEELETVRARGIAFDDEERTEGVRCVASPIIDLNHDLLGAVSVSGPVSRMSEDRLDELVDMVNNTATVIRINVSYA